MKTELVGWLSAELPSSAWPSGGVGAVDLSMGLSLEGDGDTPCQWASPASERLPGFVLGHWFGGCKSGWAITQLFSQKLRFQWTNQLPFQWKWPRTALTDGISYHLVAQISQEFRIADI